MIPPRDQEGNYRWRAQVLHQADHDEDFRSAFKELCRQDIVFWLNATCWTFDPRPENQKHLGYSDADMLFLTWPFQDRFLKWLVHKIETGEDGLVEKSRDMGASWLMLSVVQWFWQFGGPGNDFKVGSRKEDFVDKIGDMDAFFPKIRYQIKRQPQWLWPRGFDPSKHMSYMNIQNPQTGSAITGESNNPYFATGGRKKAVFFDEFSKWSNTDESAWQSASDVTDCKLAISSANGRANHFYRLRQQLSGHIEVYRMHWSEHPLKTQAWYDAEKRRRSPRDLAAEVDIDYTASISNKAWENFSYQLHVTTEDLYRTEMPIVLTCDFNIEPMSWIMLHEMGPVSAVFDELVHQERTRTEYHIQEFCERYKDHAKKEIMLYGDASGAYGHTSSKRSNYAIIKDTLARHGWSVQNYVPKGNPPVAQRLDASNKRLRDWERNGELFTVINERCTALIDSLEQTKRKGDGIDKIGNADHPAEAWSYYEVRRYPVKSQKNVSTRKLVGLS